MLANLLDLANLITLGGLALAFLAGWSVLSGRPALAVALAALALVIDYVDGWAAPRLGSAFIPTLMAGLLGFAALAVAPFPAPKLKGRRRILPVSAAPGGDAPDRRPMKWI